MGGRLPIPAWVKFSSEAVYGIRACPENPHPDLALRANFF
jgi:hypothetical protein